MHPFQYLQQCGVTSPGFFFLGQSSTSSTAHTTKLADVPLTVMFGAIMWFLTLTRLCLTRFLHGISDYNVSKTYNVCAYQYLYKQFHN